MLGIRRVVEDVIEEGSNNLSNLPNVMLLIVKPQLGKGCGDGGGSIGRMGRRVEKDAKV